LGGARVSQEEATGIARAVERVRRSHRRGLKLALPTVAALGAGTALAIGAIPGSDGTITGCYVTTTNPSGDPLAYPRYGQLRVIDPTSQTGAVGVPLDPQHECLPDEATITWNQRGPQGPAGPPGGQGAQGPAGSSLVGGTAFGFSGGGKTFLKLDGIAGESTDKAHKGEIDLKLFQLGVSNVGTQAHGSGGGAGKVNIQSFTITKKLDKASPKLFQAAASGKHIKLAEVSFMKKSKGKEVDYLVFKFTDVVISSLQDGTSHGAPSEQVTLNFHKASETFLDTKGKPVQTVNVTVNAKF
jgi:type VI secretion system secreted protein Hcp